MALKAKDINNATDMRNYVEGCLNDLVEGLSTVEETMGYLHDYTLRVINLTAECVGQPASTSDEALPIADVVKSDCKTCGGKKARRELDGSIVICLDC